MDTRDEIQSLRNMYTKLLRPEASSNLGSNSNSSSSNAYNAENRRTFADTPVAESKSVGRESQSNKQILKLKMRLQNQQQMRSAPIEEVKPFLNYPPTTPHSPGVSKDIALMMQEKKYWLSRIQDDNFNLLSLLKNIQNAKLKLINQIDELELERDSLRSLLVNASLPAVQAIFDGLVAGSPVDESLLPPLLSVVMLRLKSHCDALGQRRSGDGAAWQRDEDIRQQLLRLLLRCLSNQFELLLNLQQRSERIVQLIMDGLRLPRQEGELYNEVDAEMDALRSIAEAGPHCSQATDALANSGLFHTIAAGLLDKAVSISGRELIRGAAPRSLQSQQLRNPAPAASVAATSAPSASAPTLSAEVAALVAQNEELKASLLQMRKRNAQLRTNMAAGQVSTSGLNPPQRRSSISQQLRSGSPNLANVSDRASDDPTQTGDQWAEEDDSTAPKKSAAVPEESYSGSAVAGPDSGVEGGPSSVAGSDLPTDSLLDAFFDSQLKNRCALLLEGRTHPLCAGIGEDLLSSIAAPLASAVRPAAEPVFIAQLQRNLKESFAKEDSAASIQGKQQLQLSIEDVGEGGWRRVFNRFTRFEDADEDLKSAAFSAVEQCMQDPTVQNELGAVLSLYLTYIHISRKVVVPLPPPTLKTERIERRPAPAAPVLSIPADATVAAANSTAEIPIHSQDISDSPPSPSPPPPPPPVESGTKTKKVSKTKASSSKKAAAQHDLEKGSAAEGKAAESIPEGSSKTKAKSKKADKDPAVASIPPPSPAPVIPPPPPPAVPSSSTVTTNPTSSAGAADSATKQLQDTFKIPKTTKKKAATLADS
eukprot:gene33435-43215_t